MACSDFDLYLSIKVPFTYNIPGLQIYKSNRPYSFASSESKTKK